MELKKALLVIEDYKKESPHYGGLLDILGEILVLREQFYRKLNEDVFSIDEKYVDAKLTGGMPLVDFNQSMNLQASEEYFRALSEALANRFPEEMEFLNEFAGKGLAYFDLLIAYNVIETPESKSGASLEAVPDVKELNRDDADENDADSFDVIGMMLRESLRPGFMRVIEKYSKELLAHQWQEGFCPICGSEPRIGEIKGEEGHRHLYCHQCGYEWIFPRIMCPFCGNSDQQSLLYFTVEGDENYRVDTCNECRQYIKIVDLRAQKRETNLEIEDIATIHLDIIANDEGYE